MKRKLVIIFVTGLILTGTALAAHYDFGQCQPRIELLSTLTELKINDAQKHAIAAILKRHKAEFKTAVISLKNDRGNLRKAIWMEHSNQNAVKAAYEMMASSGEKVVLLTVKVFGKIEGVLTPKQRRIFRERKDRINKAIACKIQSRRALLDKWVALNAE